MKRILLLAFLLIQCTSFADHRISAEKTEETETTYPSGLIGCEINPDEQAAKERKEKIEAELASLENHPWAGIYKERRFLHYQMLYLAPESGFVHARHTDFSYIGYNYGDITCEDGRLKLSLARENHTRKSRVPETEYILIPWGEERYLVPEEKMMEFCEQFNCGWYPRFFRQGERWTKLVGLPEVPEEYRKYLLNEAFDAEILSVGEPSENAFPVTLNWGSRDGLYAGMKLRVTLSDHITRFEWNSLEITAVTETQAEGIFRKHTQTPWPKEGWRISAPREWAEE